jgi:phosphoribosyl 1,2-cyclic phosphodiesterase
MEFCVLASGSSGNVSLARHGSFGVLIDMGLGPRRLERALGAAGHDWDDVHAVLLTHTHGDHWNAASMEELRRRRIPLYCHKRQARDLAGSDSPFPALERDGLVRLFELDQPLALTPELRGTAFAVPHDAALTCGFRLEARDARTGLASVLGYAADLGSWTTELVQRLKNVDILALEFNHDETLQRESGRPNFLIQRVLGARGHLSNHQAAQLVLALLRSSQPGRLAHLFQLHLSCQCNEPELARRAAEQVQAAIDWELTVHTTCPDRPTAWARRRTSLEYAIHEFRQAVLPGWEGV